MGLFSFFRKKSVEANDDIIQQGEGHWWSPGQSWNAETLSGEVVSDRSVMTSATCYACSKVLSESVAGLPSAIMQGLKNRHETERDNPAWQLLCDSPNEEMDSFTFMELIVNRAVNGGNFFAEIQRDRSDRPIALWPLHPSRVKPMRDSDGSLFWQISNDYQGAPEWSDPSWRKKNLTYLSPHNMLNVVGFGSLNGVIGPGIAPGAQEIGIDFAARRYGSEFFRNGAKPAGFVEHPGWIADPAKRENFRADLNRIHSSNRHQSGVLWEGAKYHEIGMSPEQAQMLETRKYTAHQLCYMYGVPPAIIGDYEDSKFVTAEAMIRFFVMMTLRNLVVRIERAINRQVMRVRNVGKLESAFKDQNLAYELVLDGLLRGDPETQATVWKMMRESGVATANDWLRDVGMNPVEGPEGEYRIVPGGYVRLENIDNQGDRVKNQETASSRDKLVSLIQPFVSRPSVVRGYTPTPDMADIVCDLGLDAITRIHSITETQIQRWREQEPKLVSDKLPSFWQKQEERLNEALKACEKLASRINPAAEVSRKLTQKYLSQLTPLDYHDIFDASKTALDLAEYRKFICDQF